MRYTIGLSTLLASFAMLAPVASAAPWVEDKAFFNAAAGSDSYKVDAADLIGDGLIDLVFANGDGFFAGDDSSARPQQAFYNNAGKAMTDVSAALFKGKSYTGRAVKLRDVDHDGDIDIVLGTTWNTQSQLFLNNGVGIFSNETATHLPQDGASVGDLELGDVDGDGDLDMVLADWGMDVPADMSTGGITRLWRQLDQPAGFGEPGTGMFEDVTFARMPLVKVRFSWDLELVDIDNDYDLDILVSAFVEDTINLHLFTNDGTGTFKDAAAGKVSQGKSATDVEAMDLNGDGFLDLVTLQDRPSFGNRVLLNDQRGGFIAGTAMLWPPLENPLSHDFAGAFLDIDSNTQVDLVLGAHFSVIAQPPDRLMLGTGGKFEQWGALETPKYQAFEESYPSGTTTAIVLADFNGDHRLDVAMAQSDSYDEMPYASKVLLATDLYDPDTAPPIFVNVEKPGVLAYPGTATLRFRCHDTKSPLMLHDFAKDGLPYLEYWTTQQPSDPDQDPGTRSDPAQWYGEYLWRVQFEIPDADSFFYRLCAVDAAGNKSCNGILQTAITGSDPDTDSTSSTTSTGDTTASASDGISDSAPTAPDTMTSVTGMLTTTGTTAMATAGADPGPVVDPNGCVCNSREAVGALPAWLLLPLLLRRRVRA